MTDVTRILSAIEQGDPQAAAQLLPLIYDELRKLAAQRLAQEKPGQTLQATALVHEAYVRLVDVDQAQRWNSRGHFFAAAAEAMRGILVDAARAKRAEHRDGVRARHRRTGNLGCNFRDRGTRAGAGLSLSSLRGGFSPPRSPGGPTGNAGPPGKFS